MLRSCRTKYQLYYLVAVTLKGGQVVSRDLVQTAIYGVSYNLITLLRPQVNIAFHLNDSET